MKLKRNRFTGISFCNRLSIDVIGYHEDNNSQYYWFEGYSRVHNSKSFWI